MKSKTTAPLSSRQRMLRLASTSASIATLVAKYTARRPFKNKRQHQKDTNELHKEIGLLLAETLGEMKGALMKIGQILSQVKDVLPVEVTDALGQLREHAPEMPYALVVEQIERSLGAPPDVTFKQLDPKAYRAASLGQVHRATTHDGEAVVVKVQYPDVRAACESDLRQFRRLLSLAGIVKVDKARLDQIFEQVQALIMRELDFKQEAEHLKIFAEFHAAHSFVTIPKVIPSLSTDSVLTMAFQPGKPLAELEQAKNQHSENQALRDKIALNLLKLFCEQVFNFNQIHIDPHAGNFAYHEDGSIILYDFGAVAHFTPEVISAFKALLKATLAGDCDALEQCLEERGLKKTRDPIAHSFYQDWTDLMRMLMSDQPFDFAQSDVHIQAVDKFKDQWRFHFKHFAPAPESIMLNRLVIGHYWNFVRLGARIAIRPILDGYIKR